MLPLVEVDKGICLGNAALALRHEARNGLFATLSAGKDLADLLLVSSCHAADRPDFSYAASEASLIEQGGAFSLELTSSSTAWQSKRYCWRSVEDVLEYYFEVEGEGRIESCEFFQGLVGQPLWDGRRWPGAGYEQGLYGRVRSRPHFATFFNPEPNGLRKQRFSVQEQARIGVRNERGYCRGNWYFTPGPFCYVIPTPGERWLAIGLAVRPGENNFVDFEFRGGNGFGLSLRYEGRLKVSGVWESPHIVLLLAADEYAAVERYCEFLRDRGYVPGAENEEARAEASFWWREPIFCGWGEQSWQSIASARTVKTADFAIQETYERFMQQLEERDLAPGIIIIDDKWQANYGEPLPDPQKWPDLAGFIAGQHERKRHVLLWLKAWDAEGVPAEECITTRFGRVVGVDPTSPAYERRLRRCIRRLVGEYDADGFKIDFTADLPREGQSQGSLWGVELLHRLLWIIRDEAKMTKLDALIIAHSSNPYFCDVVDMVRLNDIAIVPGPEAEGDSYLGSMVHRARVARAVSHDWLIDTDNWPSPSLASWLEYVRAQPTLGVPSLYYLSHIDESGEAIPMQAFGEIARIWQGYREQAFEEIARI